MADIYFNNNNDVMIELKTRNELREQQKWEIWQRDIFGKLQTSRSYGF